MRKKKKIKPQKGECAQDEIDTCDAKWLKRSERASFSGSINLSLPERAKVDRTLGKIGETTLAAWALQVWSWLPLIRFGICRKPLERALIGSSTKACCRRLRGF
jgi:hypothetical protein